MLQIQEIDVATVFCWVVWECSLPLGMFIPDCCSTVINLLKGEIVSCSFREITSHIWESKFEKSNASVTYCKHCTNVGLFIQITPQVYCFPNPQNYTKSFKTSKMYTGKKMGNWKGIISEKFNDWTTRNVHFLDLCLSLWSSSSINETLIMVKSYFSNFRNFVFVYIYILELN